MVMRIGLVRPIRVISHGEKRKRFLLNGSVYDGCETGMGFDEG